MKGDLLKVTTVKAESFLLLCVEHNMKSYDEVLNTHTHTHTGNNLSQISCF